MQQNMTETDWSSTEGSTTLVENLSDSQIYQLVIENVQTSDFLTFENEMFERYLLRIDPPTKTPVQDPQFTSTHMKKVDYSSFRQKKSKHPSIAIDRFIQLTDDQKCEIADKERNELAEGLQKNKAEFDKHIEHYQAMSQEIGMGLNDIKKEMFQFERDIVKGAISNLTNTVKAEQCVRYFEERQRLRDALREKMLLKGANMKFKEKKLTFQLKQKEKVGDLLDEVDFNQLRIVNQQYIQTLSERCQDLLRMKITAGSTMQVLNMYKKRNQTLTKEADKLDREIIVRNESKKKLEAEIQVIDTERLQAEYINKHLRKHIAICEVPTIMEYVMQNSDHFNINQKLKTWDRKVHMAESVVKSNQRVLKKLTQTLHEKTQEKLRANKAVNASHGIPAGNTSGVEKN